MLRKPVALETLPLYSNTAKVLKLFAYCIEDHWRCYIFLFFTTLLNISEILNVVLSKLDLVNLVVNLFLSVLWLSANMRAVILIFNRKTVDDFLTDIHYMYMDIMEQGDQLTKELLVETANAARRFGNINMLLGSFSCTGMVISSYMSEGRGLIFDMYLPLFDHLKFETPWFQILFAVQFILMPIGCCMFMTFINLMIALVMFISFMCQVLQRELRALKVVPPDELNEKLVKFMRFHNIISSYVDRINNLTTYIYSLEFVFFGALMCVSLFLLIIVHNIYQRLIISAYATMVFVQITIIYFYANRLYFESLGIADAAYDTNWYEYQCKSRMILKLMMLRSQRPICLTMGNFHPMTLEVLKTLMNFTYSYVAILRNMLK